MRYHGEDSKIREKRGQGYPLDNSNPFSIDIICSLSVLSVPSVRNSGGANHNSVEQFIGFVEFVGFVGFVGFIELVEFVGFIGFIGSVGFVGRSS